MAINQVKTVAEEKNYFFLENQSSILHTIETNDITVNGVNVIVNKPKKGDIMCITRYKENDVLLDADKQEVIWIDGLSINLKQLSPLYEAVGICVSVKGNKAMVRYKEERTLLWWDSQSGVNYLPGDYLFFSNSEPLCIYLNNGHSYIFAGCCRALRYDALQLLGPMGPTELQLTDIMNFVNKSDFESNPYCQILRDNFSSYEEYLESLMVKFPCGRGGVITEEPCGKDNTYKIASIIYNDPNYRDDRAISETQYAYPAANYAASISLNAPNLGEGNWWMPSAAEMIEMMRDITYDTSFWDTNPDIINRVLSKLNSFDSSWSMMSAATPRWTSSILRQSRRPKSGRPNNYSVGPNNSSIQVIGYWGHLKPDDFKEDVGAPPEEIAVCSVGNLLIQSVNYENSPLKEQLVFKVSPITIYEF